MRANDFKKDKIVKGYVPAVIGAVLLILGLFVFKANDVKAISGLCFGLGAGLLGMSLSNLANIRYLEHHPEVLRQSKIESADERNVMINHKAKAKTLDILQWFIIGIAYVTILMETSIWLTLICVAVFALKYILETLFMIKYQKSL